MTKEEMDAIRQLAGCFNEFRLAVVQRLTVLETHNTDTRKAVEDVSAKLDNFNSRLSAGSERFVSIFNRLGAVEEYTRLHEKESRANLWRIIGWAAPSLILGAMLAYSFLTR